MKAMLLASAKIGKTHGVNGYLRLFSLSGEYSHLKKLTSCSVVTKEGRELFLDVDSILVSEGMFLIRFCGYESPEKARALSQGILYIPRDKAPKLKKGEYYVADLYNMEVLVEGNRVGVVEGTWEGAQALMLIVRKDSDQKVYVVPNLPVYVSSIDVDSNTLVLEAPYLLE